VTRSTVVSADLIDEALAAIIEHAYIACGVGAEAAVKDMREQISESVGSGVKYPRLPNRSSAPLEAPVNQFGDLHDSIHVDLSPDIIGIGAAAVVDDETGKFLEFGTSKMRPRPFAGPGAVVGAEATEAYVKTIPARLENL
jgi:hypothetical protein